MVSESFDLMNEITNEGDGEGPGCLMQAAGITSLIVVSSLLIAFIIAMAGYALVQ